jgi:hypothetical protein
VPFLPLFRISQWDKLISSFWSSIIFQSYHFNHFLSTPFNTFSSGLILLPYFVILYHPLLIPALLKYPFQLRLIYSIILFLSNTSFEFSPHNIPQLHRPCRDIILPYHNLHHYHSFFFSSHNGAGKEKKSAQNCSASLFKTFNLQLVLTDLNKFHHYNIPPMA